MNPNVLLVRLGVLASVLAAGILVVMMAMALAIGPELANLQSASPQPVAELFANSAGKLRGLMVLDDLFALAYMLAFIGLAAQVRNRSGLLAGLGLGFGLATGVLDWIENSMTLNLIAFRLIEPPALFALNMLTQMKYLASNGAVVLLGLGLWETRWLNRAATILFLLYAPINVLAFIAPPFVAVRFASMFILLLVGTALLMRADNLIKPAK